MKFFLKTLQILSITSLSVWLLISSVAAQSPTRASISQPLLDAFQQVLPTHLPPDSLFLAKLEAWAKPETSTSYFDDDHLNGDEGWRIVKRLDFDGDGIQDYFFCEFTWIPPMGAGSIINGKSGRAFSVCGQKNEYLEGPLFWWRPSFDQGIEFKIIDVDCGDGQDELAIVHCAGPPNGEYHAYDTRLNIFRYDKDSCQVKTIFQETISETGINTADTLWDVETSLYLDFLYHDQKCLDEIEVFAGYRTQKQYPMCHDDIRKRKGPPLKTFKIDLEKNMFVEKK